MGEILINPWCALFLDMGMHEKKVRKWVSVKIDEETHELLRRIGEEEGIMSISSVIKYLTKQYMKRLGKGDGNE